MAAGPTRSCSCRVSRREDAAGHLLRAEPARPSCPRPGTAARPATRPPGATAAPIVSKMEALAIDAHVGRRLRAHAAAARLLRHPPQQWHRTAYLLICTSKYSEYIGVVCLSLCGLIRGPRGRTRWARLEILARSGLSYMPTHLVRTVGQLRTSCATLRSGTKRK